MSSTSMSYLNMLMYDTWYKQFTVGSESADYQWLTH